MDNRKNEKLERTCTCGCAVGAGYRCNPCTCKNCNCWAWASIARQVAARHASRRWSLR